MIVGERVCTCVRVLQVPWLLALMDRDAPVFDPEVAREALMLVRARAGCIPSPSQGAPSGCMRCCTPEMDHCTACA